MIYSILKYFMKKKYQNHNLCEEFYKKCVTFAKTKEEYYVFVQQNAKMKVKYRASGCNGC